MQNEKCWREHLHKHYTCTVMSYYIHALRVSKVLRKQFKYQPLLFSLQKRSWLFFSLSFLCFSIFTHILSVSPSTIDLTGVLLIPFSTFCTLFCSVLNSSFKHCWNNGKLKVLMSLIIISRHVPCNKFWSVNEIRLEYIGS